MSLETLQSQGQNQLEPLARQALGNVSPELAWEQIRTQVENAIENQEQESQQAAQKNGLPTDLTDLVENLGVINPARAINLFHYANPKFNLQQIAKQKPLDVLKAVLKMETQSDRFQA